MNADLHGKFLAALTFYIVVATRMRLLPWCNLQLTNFQFFAPFLLQMAGLGFALSQLSLQNGGGHKANILYWRGCNSSQSFPNFGQPDRWSERWSSLTRSQTSQKLHVTMMFSAGRHLSLWRRLGLYLHTIWGQSNSLRGDLISTQHFISVWLNFN